MLAGGCCTRTISSPAAGLNVPVFGSISENTIHPLAQLAAPGAAQVFVLPAAKLHTDILNERRNASERAKRISFTKSMAALRTDRLISKELKLGKAIATKMAIMATTTKSSMRVKPFWRFFMLWRLIQGSAVLQVKTDVRQDFTAER
jgi:hypothetical protein